MFFASIIFDFHPSGEARKYSHWKHDLLFIVFSECKKIMKQSIMNGTMRVKQANASQRVDKSRFYERNYF